MVNILLDLILDIFCMRICEKGDQIPDPCNVKDDTRGCFYTMGITSFNVAGFDDYDISTGQTTTFNVSLPPLRTSTVTSTSTQTVISNSGLYVSNDMVIKVAASALFALIF